MKEIDLEKLYDLAGSRAVALEEELYHFSRMLFHDFELKLFFENGAIPPANKKLLLPELFPRASSLFIDLVDLLIDEELFRRLGWLEREYSKLISRKTGTKLVEITSGREMSEDEKKMIGRSLEGRLRFEDDPKIIGGIKIKWEDGRYLDASLAGILDKLKEEILV